MTGSPGPKSSLISSKKTRYNSIRSLQRVLEDGHNRLRGERTSDVLVFHDAVRVEHGEEASQAHKVFTMKSSEPMAYFLNCFSRTLFFLMALQSSPCIAPDAGCYFVHQLTRNGCRFIRTSVDTLICSQLNVVELGSAVCED